VLRKLLFEFIFFAVVLL